MTSINIIHTQTINKITIWFPNKSGTTRLLVELQCFQRDTGKALGIVTRRARDSHARVSIEVRCPGSLAFAGIRIVFAVATGVRDAQGRCRRARAHTSSGRGKSVETAVKSIVRSFVRSLARSPPATTTHLYASRVTQRRSAMADDAPMVVPSRTRKAERYAPG